MIKKLLLSFSLSFILFSGYSQTERFSVKDNSKWKLIYYQDLTKGGVSIRPDEYYFYETSGDTLINDQSYYKVYKSGVMYFVNPAVSYSKKYQAAIRSADNKVFCIKAGKSSETLLYDFDLKIGDTIKAEVANGYVITDVDTLQDGRRVFRFFMTFRCGEEIIEGIGSNSDLFEMNRCFHSGIVGKVLTSFSNNGDLIFSGDAIDTYKVERDPEKEYQPGYNSSWRITKMTYLPVYSYDQQYIYVNGDTLVNGTNYYALYKTGIINYSDDAPGLYGPKYYGGIRNDGYKMYFIPASLNSEMLLYDFDLKVGDRIKSNVYKDSLITKIDTVADGRKRFYLGSGSDNIYIIEGIGSNYTVLDTSADEYFECYSEKGIPVAYNFDCTSCINDYTKNLFPNDELHISHQAEGEYILDGKTHFDRLWNVPQPEISKTEVDRDGNMIAVHAYYNLGDPSEDEHNYDVPVSPVPLGELPDGQYELVYFVHTIENGITSYNYKMNRIVFNASGKADNIPDDKIESALIVFPNPASRVVNLHCNCTFNHSVSVSIFNVYGTKLLEKHFSGNKQPFNQELSVENLKNGMYIVRIESGNKSINTKLIIK
jgi:hypothetical protein